MNKGETYPEQGNKVSYVSRTIARVKQGVIQGVVVVMERWCPYQSSIGRVAS